ncbi:uncharacterized protein LOC127702409 isoform X3 [Mytilus californianus]|uniref:uncharacterized protein LOC127702409 isoform X3 n=1 Tax=Mytilus californianus TaxID=6549 RepID=UPI002246CE73|nr:uncharacterized protein LOC127702409 isoform X3 [Mytilus californianus]
MVKIKKEKNVNMNTDAHISVMQTHPVQPNERISRIRALRILGGLQIILGIVCCILGMVGAIISNTEITSRCKNYHNNHGIEVYMSSYHCRQTNTILIMDIIGMAFSGWFILTGGLPLCMTGQRQSRWRCMIIAYLVCNIILAAVFSPTVVALGIIGALDHQGVIFMNTAQSGMVYSMPNTPISLENQQGYHQMQMNQMHGFNGQQPANIPNYQQQADYTQGNRIPVQENYGQHLQAFATGNQ